MTKKNETGTRGATVEAVDRQWASDLWQRLGVHNTGLNQKTFMKEASRIIALARSSEVHPKDPGDTWDAGVRQAASIVRAEAAQHPGTPSATLLASLSKTLDGVADNYPGARRSKEDPADELTAEAEKLGMYRMSPALPYEAPPEGCWPGSPEVFTTPCERGTPACAIEHCDAEIARHRASVEQSAQGDSSSGDPSCYPDDRRELGGSRSSELAESAEASALDGAEDYSWIKVPRFVDDPTKSWEDRFKTLEAHHERETTFLIEEVERLRKDVPHAHSVRCHVCRAFVRQQMYVESLRAGKEIPQNLAPPWVLFSDKDKPVAILPAMRPGEVCSVTHLTMKEAQRIVNVANELYSLAFEARLKGISKAIENIAALFPKIEASTDEKMEESKDCRDHCLTLLYDAISWTRGNVITKEMVEGVSKAIDTIRAEGPVSSESFLAVRKGLLFGGFNVAPPLKDREVPCIGCGADIAYDETRDEDKQRCDYCEEVAGGPNAPVAPEEPPKQFDVCIMCDDQALLCMACTSVMVERAFAEAHRPPPTHYEAHGVEIPAPEPTDAEKALGSEEFHEGWLTGLMMAAGIARGEKSDRVAELIEGVVEHCPHKGSA